MNIIPNGTEVLIFKQFMEGGRDDENYIIGIVQSSKISDDLSYHGSPWYEQIYEVLGEDGKRYRGTYGSCWIGNCFIRTKEDHISILRHRIINNEEEILKLQEILKIVEKKDRYYRQIIELENKSKRYEKKEQVITKKLIPPKQCKK